MRSAAASIAGAEKSSPVTCAPSRAHDSVSRPKWHCRCTSDEPADVAELLGLERAQRGRAGEEAVDVVEVARRVERDALVPPRPVEVAHNSLSSPVISLTLDFASPKSIAVFGS